MNTHPSDALDKPGITWGLFILVGLCSYARLFYGVDFTDESLYVAGPYAFLHGHHPFENEHLFQINASVLLTPLVALFTSATGGTDGIILFFRHCFFAMLLATALIGYECFRQFFSGPIALFGATLLVAAYPLSAIPNLSYNTIGVHCIFIAFFLWGYAKGSDRMTPAIHLVVGTLLAIACCFYPSFVLIVAGCVGFAFWKLKSREIIYFIAPIFLIGLAWGMYFWWIGPEHVLSSIRYNLNAPAYLSTHSKLEELFNDVWGRLSVYFISWLILGVGLLVRFIQPKRALATLWMTSVIILGLETYFLVPNTGPEYFALFTILMGVWIAELWSERKIRELCAYVFFPSLIVACIHSFTSSNNFLQFQFAILPAYACFICLLAQKAAEEFQFSGRSLALASAAILLSGKMIWSQFNLIYGDLAFEYLTQRVPSGPFSGLYTHTKKRNFLIEIESDLRQHVSINDTIFFFDNFPAGYLFTTSKPATPCLWTSIFLTPAYRDLLVSHFSNTKALPDTVIEGTKLSLGQPATGNAVNTDPLRKVFASDKYEQVLAKSDYRIWKKKPASWK